MRSRRPSIAAWHCRGRAARRGAAATDAPAARRVATAWRPRARRYRVAWRAMAASVEREAEWLEADGLGGFASGTASGVRTRRYHALLLAAAAPPGDRRALVQGFVAWLVTPAG